MCAIFGFVTTNNKYRQEHLEKMGKILHHRGPDGTEILRSDIGVHLGHNRLSIIDLSKKGKQPMSNEDGSIWLTYNGEIYNFQEIREELKNKKHLFKSDTDSEVVIHAYEEWGLDCLEKFNGMFAFAIYDKNKNQLILVRDRLGIKPLYYLVNNNPEIFASETQSAFRLRSFLTLKRSGGGGATSVEEDNNNIKNILRPQSAKVSNFFAFSSEIKGLRALTKLKPNLQAIKKLLGFPYLPDNTQTTIEGVYKLPPAHYLVYDIKSGKAEIKRYWRLDVKKKFRELRFESALEELENKLVNSIKMQLVADVPVGIMLSGGLDSSVIAAIAQKNSKQKIHTFTAGSDTKIDEREFARKVADHIGSIHQEIIIDPANVIENIEKSIKYFDDLNTFDGGLLTNHLIAEKMREKGVKVILLGEGADEIFGGYSWFGISKSPFNLLPMFFKKYLYYYSISRNLSFNPLRGFQLLQRSGLWRKTFDAISNCEITQQLPNNYLMKVDKGTMSGSVEARVPYLDHDLVEFAYSLPANFKLKGLSQSFGKVNEKYILRELAKKYLPLDIAMRKKKGGMLPIADIIKNNIGKIEKYLLAENSLSTQIFGRKKIEKLFRGNIENLGKSNWNFREVEREIFLWKLFLLEVWNKNLNK